MMILLRVCGKPLSAFTSCSFFTFSSSSSFHADNGTVKSCLENINLRMNGILFQRWNHLSQTLANSILCLNIRDFPRFFHAALSGFRLTRRFNNHYVRTEKSPATFRGKTIRKYVRKISISCSEFDRKQTSYAVEFSLPQLPRTNVKSFNRLFGLNWFIQNSLKVTKRI